MHDFITHLKEEDEEEETKPLCLFNTDFSFFFFFTSLSLSFAPLSSNTVFSLSPPGAVPPAHLAAADLPGNRGFDPMCLGADPKALAW